MSLDSENKLFGVEDEVDHECSVCSIHLDDNQGEVFLDDDGNVFCNDTTHKREKTNADYQNHHARGMG